jgi:hypothetical protein
MSAVLQLPMMWEPSQPQPDWEPGGRARGPRLPEASADEIAPENRPAVSLGFYRKHTERMLRRYLYASMQVGRAPSIFGDPVSRGWVSSRPVRTFEEVVIFVLDMERCLDRLTSLDRQMLSRVVLQEYTQAEASSLMGMSARAISYKFPQALDRLTEMLLETGLLVLPH